LCKQGPEGFMRFSSHACIVWYHIYVRYHDFILFIHLVTPEFMGKYLAESAWY
jgi:hypothetical protein